MLFETISNALKSDNFQQNCLKFCLKLAMDEAKVAYFVNKRPFNPKTAKNEMQGHGKELIIYFKSWAKTVDWPALGVWRHIRISKKCNLNCWYH